jgi:hypothetical protein
MPQIQAKLIEQQQQMRERPRVTAIAPA